MPNELLLLEHGGYSQLKSFQLAQLVYDVTVRFCNQYIDRRSRTHDQMVQAARSGVQNIAEGSQAAATSKKTELKLTNVARASLEELRLDYEDYLRHRGHSPWNAAHPALKRFKTKRCATLNEIRNWVNDERARMQCATDQHGRTRTNTDNSVRHSSPPLKFTAPSAVLVANAALSLLNICCHLLDRQLAAQVASFEKNGGFTERLYHRRMRNRRRP